VFWDAQPAEFDDPRLRFAEDEHGWDILASPSCGPVERGLYFLVFRGAVVGVVGFCVAPVADVPGVDGECILPRVLVLGDTAVVRDEYERCRCVRSIRAKVTYPAGVFDTGIEWATNPPEELVVRRGSSQCRGIVVRPETRGSQYRDVTCVSH